MQIAIVEEQRLLSESIALLLGVYTIGTKAETFKSIDHFKNACHSGYKPEILLYGTEDFAYADIAEFLQKEAAIRLIVMASAMNANTARKMLSSGVAGVLCKTSDVKCLLEAIGSVRDGNIFVDKCWQEDIYKTVIDSSPSQSLTPREHEVLYLLCCGYTAKEIAGKMNVSVSTIQFFIKGLFRKFNLNRTVDLVIHAMSLGLHKNAANTI